MINTAHLTLSTYHADSLDSVSLPSSPQLDGGAGVAVGREH